MQTRVIDTLADLPAQAWNNLVQERNPFLNHAFLSAMERHECVGERNGWWPRHIVCYDGAGRLCGALPLYSKDNSWGEFIFDWAWADAYHRHGVAYYPKLVCAVPFTPATGQRLLIAADAPRQQIGQSLIERARQEAEALGCSSLHCLFPSEADMRLFEQQNFMVRLGCQYHWHNQDYTDFEGFLNALNAKKRKNIRRERRLVYEAGIDLRIVRGDQVEPQEWRSFYAFYRSTFQMRGRHPPLTLAFFQDIARTMGDQIVLVMARKNGQDVAAAISYQSATTLYGRHWGCRSDYDSLHFETCYYQGIDYCIRHGLQGFEPGAQGEHKIWRGFLPTITRSAHWLAHPSFSEAVGDFLRRERPAIREHARLLSEHSPYRQDRGAA